MIYDIVIGSIDGNEYIINLSDDLSIIHNGYVVPNGWPLIDIYDAIRGKVFGPLGVKVMKHNVPDHIMNKMKNRILIDDI